MDVSGSLFFLFYPEVPKKIAGGSRGKHENELQPAASQGCQLSEGLFACVSRLVLQIWKNNSFQTFL